MMEEHEDKNGTQKSNEEKVLPFCVIKATTEGDVLAIHSVMKHYEGYIRHLSVRGKKGYERPSVLLRGRNAATTILFLIMILLEIS